MNRRATVLVALVTLAILPTASASAEAPWWDITTGARPTNLWEPEDEVQELIKGPGQAVVSVAGTQVACMGALCAFTHPTLPRVVTAAQLESALEVPAAYGSGNIEVTGPSSGRFLITSVNDGAGRWVPAISVTGTGASTKVLTEGGSGRLALILTNLGTAPVDGAVTPVTIAYTLPEGFAAHHVEAFAGELDKSGPASCAIETTSSVSCSFADELSPYEAIEIEVYASLTASPPAAGEPGQVSVSGGGAPAVSTSHPVTVSEEETPFGVESFSVRAEHEGGAPATQAGSHPFQLTTTLQLNSGRLRSNPNRLIGNRPETVMEQPALPRNFRFKLPAGLIGNATGVPRCSFDQFATVGSARNECPAASAIGAASATFIEPFNYGLARLAVPVFNLVPGQGEPARFGFTVAGVPVVLDTGVRSGEAYGITVSVANTPQSAELLASTVSIWGAPADQRHDASRGWVCIKVEAGCTRPDGLESRPFLRLPTSCGTPLDFPMELEPWNVPLGSDVTSASFTGGALDGCNQVPFKPEITVQPDTQSGDTPTGLTVRLNVDQEASEAPEGNAVSDVRNTKVTLPPGLHVNPAGANGLQACSEAQVGFQRIDSQTGEAIFDEAPAQCPEASKLGSVEIITPLIEEPVIGSVYQAEQGANPFGSLLALYLVADAPNVGVHVKLAGKIELTADGQLVSSFEETPQLPFEEFELRIFGGDNAPLATSSCGTYKTETEIEPWSGNVAATPSSEFEVTSGPGGSACQDPQPFAPSFAAGTEAPLAGAFSPFVLRLGRADGTQRLRAIDTVLPPGLTGKLAGIPYCPEAAIAQAAGRGEPGEGAIEQASPSCPAASQVGSVDVAAGAGPSPLHVGGSAYLAGPYKGAPLSMVIVTPAVTGPFDLGTVVVRAALYVDPATTQITARSDPIPQILEGIPLNVRSIALRMDRPGFTLNPTNCEAMAIDGVATSTLGQVASLHNRFQVGGCGGLAFKPKLSLRLKGATKRGKHPKLIANLRAKGGEANVARASVKLPRAAFLDQAHIRTVCTRVQFAADRCPPGSIYGRARARSPLLDYALRGKVYLRSSSNLLPDLVADLRGPAYQPIRIELVGRTDAVKGALRNTFQAVPDAPVSRFRLELFGGKRGLVQLSTNLCRGKHRRGKHRANVKLDGQNGKTHDTRPRVKTSCRKTKKRKSQRRKRASLRHLRRAR